MTMSNHYSLLLLMSSLLASTTTSARFCSTILPVHSSTRYAGPNQTLVETHLGFILPMDSSVCLMSQDNGQNSSPVLRAVFTLLHSTRLYPVTDKYQFTVPSTSISCYCQCSCAPCQLPTCPLCYSYSIISSSCHSNHLTPSTTCCSVKLSTPKPILTALQIGQPYIRLVYKLSLFSPSGQLMHSAQHASNIGQHASTVQYSMPGQGEMVLHLSKAGTGQGGYMPDSWMVASEDGRLIHTRVNHPQEHDPLLPGWLKVQDGQPVRPPNLLVQKGIHVTTDKCKEQVFSADLSGLEMRDIDFDKQASSNLVWDGKRTVVQRDLTFLTVKTSVVVRGLSEVFLYQNTTQLGTWEATLSVGTTTLLNITTRGSHGLVFGMIGNTRFSFTISSPSLPVSTISIPLHLSPLPSPVTVCLRRRTGEEQCQQVPVVHHHLLPHRHNQPLHQPVGSIPVVWQRQGGNDQQSLDRFGSDTAWKWLQKFLDISDPILVFINLAVGMVVLAVVTRCVICIVPKCNTK